MSFLLPSVGTVSYNGYTFSQYARTSARMENVLNDGSTTSKARKFSLTVVDYLQSDSGLETSGTDAFIRNTLLQPHKRLEYSGRGFGDPFVIEGSGGTDSQPDLKRGPWPTLNSWTPLGSPRAAVFTWSVECVLPPCEDASDEGLMAYEYEVGISQDANLVTSIEYSGYLEVAQPAAVSTPNRLLRTADEFRSRVDIPLLSGFRREMQSFILNKAKDRLEFKIVDTQMTDPLPDNMVDVKASYTVKESVLGSGKADANLTATYKVKPGAPKRLAWRAFNLLLGSKILSIEKAKGSVMLASNLSVSEDIYGREVTCGIGLLVKYGEPTGLDTKPDLNAFLVAKSGLFAEDDASEAEGMGSRRDANLASWRRSTQVQEDPFMGTKLRHLGGRDIVISLCKGQHPNAPPLATTSDYDFPETTSIPAPLQRPDILKAVENIVSRVSVGTQTHTAAYGSQAVRGSDGQVDTDAALTISPSGGGSQTQSVSTTVPQTQVQYTGLVFTTAAPYPIPEVKTIDGVKPFMIGESDAASALMGVVGGTPIYRTSWTQTYALPNNVKKVSALPTAQSSDGRDPMRQGIEMARNQSTSAFQTASVTGLGNPGGKNPLFV